MNVWILTMFLMMTAAVGAHGACGDGGPTCGDDERCCEHVIATFSDDHAIAPPYVEGQCIPKTEKCTDFWCGNRHCQAGLFGTPSVCCINTPNMGSTSKYSCASSELNCPGNSQQLSIRDNQPTRKLQRT